VQRAAERHAPLSPVTQARLCPSRVDIDAALEKAGWVVQDREAETKAAKPTCKKKPSGTATST
jgi:hypothetical protein